MHGKMKKGLAGLLAVLLLAAGLGGCGSSAAEDWESKYQTAAAELEQAQEKIASLEENVKSLEEKSAELQKNTVSSEEIQTYTNRIAELESKNAEQAAELQDRQAQIDALWVRVDAAQKNLDEAYAKLDGIVKQTAHPPWSYSGDGGGTIYAAESFLQRRQIAFIGSITAQTVVICFDPEKDLILHL